MSKPIKILQVTPSLSSNGGIEETIRILCTRLDKKKFRLGVCPIRDQPRDVLKEFKETGADFFYYPRKGRIFDVFTIFWLRKIITDFQFDIIHTHSNKGNFHGRLAGMLAGKVSIVTTHHDLGDLIFSKTPVLREERGDRAGIRRPPYMNIVYSVVYPFFNVRLNKLNSKIITVSSIVKKVYSSEPDNPLFETVYAPYDETIFRPNYQGLRGKRIVLGVVGRLEREKGHLCLLRAFTELIRSHRNLFLIIIGDGTLRNEIDLFIEKNDLRPYVLVRGNLSHSADLYNDIDIYIQPSLLEGCSITLLEAMGTGIPIIASNVGGPKELVIPNETGLLVPPNDPAALKAAILDLIGNRKKAVGLGRAGSERALKNFSSKIFIDKMSRIYQDLAGNAE